MCGSSTIIVLLELGTFVAIKICWISKFAIQKHNFKCIEWICYNENMRWTSANNDYNKILWMA